MDASEAIKRSTVRIDLQKRPSHSGWRPDPEPESRTTVAVPEDLPGYEHFLELFESVYDGILIATYDGAILHTNQRARDLFLFAEDEFTTLTVVELFSGSDADTLGMLSRTLEDQRRIFIECYCNRGDGTSFPAEVTVNSAHFLNQKQLFFFVRDITVRKETEAALKRAEEDILLAAHKAGMAEIATGVLHDVGNVLNSISVSCDMIAGVARQDTVEGMAQANAVLREHEAELGTFLTTEGRAHKLLELYAYVETALLEDKTQILDEATRLQGKVRLIREIITTQQDNAKLGLFFQEIAVSDAVRDALALQKTHLENHDIELQLTCDSSLTLTTQKTKLVYILVNLINNAVDALKGVDAAQCRRVLRVEAGSSADGRGLVLTVSDNGVGIAPENLTSIFEHGFTTKAKGHGFGLHTCANFMNEIGGRITAHSDGLGTGSTFRLELALERPETEGTADV